MPATSQSPCTRSNWLPRICDRQYRVRLFFDRLANLRLAESRNDFTHVPMFTMRSLRELHLEFDPITNPMSGPMSEKGVA